MKTLFALLALLISTAAYPVCYMIYSSSNELVWRGETPPVPMNTPSLDDEVRKKVPKGHMVIVNDLTAPCFPLDVTDRKSMRDKAEAIKYD